MTDQPIRSVAASLLDYLALEGALKIFGVPGGAAVYVMNELRQRDDIQFVICRQESGAAYMAHGYSLVTGSLGVVLTTSGPGAANALTGALNAENSGAPVLVITGYSTESSAIEAANLGVNGYLTKPFRVSQVLGKTAKALGIEE